MMKQICCACLLAIVFPTVADAQSLSFRDLPESWRTQLLVLYAVENTPVDVDRNPVTPDRAPYVSPRAWFRARTMDFWLDQVGNIRAIEKQDACSPTGGFTQAMRNAFEAANGFDPCAI